MIATYANIVIRPGDPMYFYLFDESQQVETSKDGVTLPKLVGTVTMKSLQDKLEDDPSDEVAAAQLEAIMKLVMPKPDSNN